MKNIILFIQKYLLIIFLASFGFLFIGNNLLFYSKYISITFYSLSFLFILIPIISITYIDAIKTFYPKDLRKIAIGIISTGILFYIIYILQSDLCLNKWVYQAKFDTIKVKLQKLDTILEIIYLILLFIIFISSIIFQTAFNTLKTNTAKIYNLKDIVINIALLFCFFISINYLANIRPVSIDLTLIGKFSLSEDGKRIIKSIDKDRKIVITAFYPYFHQLQRDVEIILTNITQANPNITFTIVDALKEKNIATAKKIDRNGIIVFESVDPKEFDISKREHSEKIEIQSEEDLKNMEQRIVGAILNITHPQKTIYFTSGHGEISDSYELYSQRLKLWMEELGRLNYNIQYLDIKNGFPPTVPNNAEAICILSPSKNFSKDEQEALIVWLKNGGKILLTLDTEKNVDFSFLLNLFHINYVVKPVLSDNSVKNQKQVIIATEYEDHPITQSFAHLSARENFTVFPTIGSFETQSKETISLNENNKYKFPEVTKNYFIKSTQNSWLEVIQNNKNDSGQEPFKSFNLAVATSGIDTVTKKSFRFVAYPDTDFLLDEFIIYPGKNYELSVNTVKWLLSDEAIDGILPKSFESKKIALTPLQDDIVFYFLVLIYPLLIISLGNMYLRRKRKQNLKNES